VRSMQWWRWEKSTSLQSRRRVVAQVQRS